MSFSVPSSPPPLLSISISPFLFPSRTPSTIVRNVSESELCEMEGTVTLDSNLLKGQASLQYKYYIYCKQRAEEITSPFEFLYGTPGFPSWGQKVVNRRIFIPKSRFVAKGEAP